ncbi:unnamed protein product [Mytilus coruscus]|uniref:Fibrinogen C-terminal domain-containing protein n=1 Tax=Mytilus coruscus TaxID=42192 RepID=A0A6J8C8Y0_MYTCO|nr:unnamed protein product [Mytilus coruscus]
MTDDEHDITGYEHDITGDEHNITGDEHNITGDEHDITGDVHHDTGVIYNENHDTESPISLRHQVEVIQKRFNGVTEFYRNWQDYENGFGDLNNEFWLGNKYIAMLTSRGNHELRIDLEDWNGEKRYALFTRFKVGDQSNNYRLTISGYSGNAGS